MTEDKRTCAECKYCDFSGSEFPCSECTSNTDYFETKVSRWIPCSERLPEEGAVVLVSLEKDEDYDWVRLVREGYYDEGYWFDVDGAHYGLEVLAWMPLPEPYEKEGVKK